ncbi:class E sortase [candidate division WWE3 bacterium]|uniref:Class E sortase n=1 Tax=candidate division WWE3 bacterium TaxID=2053526 RepID=A0A955RRT2_UNCKA|nr:class E sortase [candidate division WWE3 bacterium]
MIEERFKFKKLVGVILVTVGVVGVSYLGWTFFVWSRTLPTFPQENVLKDAPSFYADKGGGFGEMLSDNKEDGVGETGETLPGESTALLPIDRVLGAQDNDADYDTGSVRLTIPRLNIDNAKVALDVNGDDERIYDGVLTQAVAHLKKSAYPGQVGNVFLFGHSMLPLLTTNNYESIFTNLPKVKTGDVVRVTQNNTVYTYQISQTGVVEPSDVFIMNQPQTKRMITLMTCIPPGFSSNRYITVGELINVEELN